MPARRCAITFAVASSVLSSAAWIFQDRAVVLLTPLAVAAAQGLLVGMLYLGHLRVSGRALPGTQFRLHWKELVQISLLRNVLGSMLVCYALVHSGSIKVMFFTKLEPYLVLFWCWLLEGKKIGRGHALLLAVHVGGAVLLSTGGRFNLPAGQWGDVMLVTAVAIFSYTYLHAARLSREIGPVHLNGITALTAGVCLLPVALIVSPGGTWNFLSIGWLHLVMVVLLFNIVAMTMWFSALRSLDGWLVSALRAVGPVLAAPFAWILLGQSLSGMQVLGAAVILVTSALLALGPSQEAAVAEAMADAEASS